MNKGNTDRPVKVEGIARESSTLHNELPATKEIQEREKWSFPAKSMPTGWSSMKSSVLKTYKQVVSCEPNRLYLESHTYTYNNNK